MRDVKETIEKAETILDGNISKQTYCTTLIGASYALLAFVKMIYEMEKGRFEGRTR